MVLETKSLTPTKVSISGALLTPYKHIQTSRIKSHKSHPKLQQKKLNFHDHSSVTNHRPLRVLVAIQT